MSATLDLAMKYARRCGTLTQLLESTVSALEDALPFVEQDRFMTKSLKMEIARTKRRLAEMRAEDEAEIVAATLAEMPDRPALRA